MDVIPFEVPPEGIEWTLEQGMIWHWGEHGLCKGKQGILNLDLDLLLFWIRRCDLARKQGKTPVSDRKPEWKGFVALPLTAERKEVYRQWKPKWTEVVEEFGDLLDAEYRVTFTAINDGKTVQCAVTCQDKQSPNAGWCMTSRAPTWKDALQVAVWKHVIVCELDWGEFLEGVVEDEWG